MRPSGGDGPWLIVSDIDDTLTGDRDALLELLEMLKGAEARLYFVLNSSRPAASVEETLRSYFPSDFVPDGLITGLGTEMHVDGAFLSDWSDRFLNWPRQDIVELILGLGHAPHPAAFQTPGKASFSVPDRAAVDLVLQVLADKALPFQAIYSGESDLDIIAPGAGKDAAMRFLAGHFGIASGRLVAAGDSGNDLAMFEAADRAIAVGNARGELRAASPRPKTYFANAHHAAGVLEGLRALGILDCTEGNGTLRSDRR